MTMRNNMGHMNFAHMMYSVNPADVMVSHVQSVNSPSVSTAAESMAAVYNAHPTATMVDPTDASSRGVGGPDHDQNNQQ